ncbi:pyridoxamine 5'-phosphate oxidase [Parenemella sanctibonifatiensis]|uniref:Pyridoxine/pyridoxamine 5'-phosphate oxidase n=1 Tax=Parenemella sanctibonifatiensis TaxID=2016505 RepID=A0A255EB40_9ACTN|nr:pyridoxamine 5'-phosphate oxidase [Parenemella sanctibonifatiensis]OYN88789.1 pyridoxamine 5'-phosphate oxidase [Parenemella sanctibonifatiensis]
MEIADRRTDYAGLSLDDEVPKDPIGLFETWLEQAIAAQDGGADIEATAMTLATASPRADGGWQPHARIVLLKGWGAEGPVFFTGYGSDKGIDLAANPYASLSFYWTPLFRQIRIEGRVEQLPQAESAAYFASRPRASQLATYASDQSRPVASRAVMEQAYAAAEARFAGAEVPMPEDWGGYRLAVERIEFWQGRPARFHDRIRYTRAADDWTHERLQP